MANLLAHIDHIQHVWKRPVIVAINRFSADTPAEMDRIREACRAVNAPCELCDGWAKGGRGRDGVGAAGGRTPWTPSPRAEPSYTYPDDMPLREKIETVARRNLRRRAGDLWPRGTQAAAKPHGGRLRRVSGMHCQDAVFLLGQSQAAGSAQGFHPEHPRGAAVRGRGVHGGLCGGILLPCPGCPGFPLRRALMWTPRVRLPGCSKKIIEIPCKKARREGTPRFFCVAGKERLCLPQGRYILCRFPFAAKGRRFPKGDRKALWSRPQARNPQRLQTDTIKYFANNRTGAPQQSDAPANLSHNKASDFLRAQGSPTSLGPEGFQRATGRALWSRPQARNPSAPANRYDPILCQQQDERAAVKRRARVLCLSPQGRIVRGFLREVMVSRTQWHPLQWLQSPPQAQAPLPSRLSFIIFHTMAPTTITSMPPMIQVAIAMLLSGRGDYAPTLIRWVR